MGIVPFFKNGTQTTAAIVLPPSVLTRLEYKQRRKVGTEVMSHHVSKMLIVC